MTLAGASLLVLFVTLTQVFGQTSAPNCVKIFLDEGGCPSCLAPTCGASIGVRATTPFGSITCNSTRVNDLLVDGKSMALSSTPLTEFGYSNQACVTSNSIRLQTLSLINHPNITDVTFKHLSTLKSVIIDNCTALDTIESRSGITGFNLSNYFGLELHLDEVPNLTDLKLALLPSLTYLLINNTNLRSMDLSGIGDRGAKGLYLDLYNISADIGRLVIASGFESSLTGMEIWDPRGAITDLVIANLSRPMGYELNGLAALKTLRLDNVTLGYVNTGGTLPGADLLIELARTSNEYDSYIEISPETLDAIAVARTTAVRLIDNPVNELYVYDLPSLRSIVVSGSSDLKELFVGRSALTSLDISGMVASDVSFKLGFGNVTNKNTPNQLTSLTIDGRLNGGALSRAVTEFWMEVDSNTTLRSLELLNMPRMSKFWLGGLGRLTSLRIVNTSIVGDFGAVDVAVRTEGVDMVFENAFDTHLIHFHKSDAIDDEVADSTRTLVFKEDGHVVRRAWVEWFPNVRELTFIGFPNGSEFGIHGARSLTSLDFSRVIGRPGALDIQLVDGISATPTAAMPGNRLSQLRFAGGSGLENSLVSLKVIREVAPGGVESVELVNLPSLRYLELDSLPALKRLRIANTSLDVAYITTITGAPGALDVVLENVAGPRASSRFEMVLDGGEGGLVDSLKTISYTDTTGFLGEFGLHSLSSLTRVTVGGSMDRIILKDVPAADLVDFAPIAPSTNFVEIRNSGLTAINMTGLRKTASISLQDNPKLTGICRLPDNFMGACSIQNNAFFADFNCASKGCGASVVVARPSVSGDVCPMPQRPSYCVGSNLIFFNVLNSTTGAIAPLCLSLDSDPTRLQGGACSVTFVQSATVSSLRMFTSCNVTTSSLFATSVNLADATGAIRFNMATGPSANPGCGYAFDATVGFVASQTVTVSRAVLCAGSTCATPAPTPVPTPAPTPAPPTAPVTVTATTTSSSGATTTSSGATTSSSSSLSGSPASIDPTTGAVDGDNGTTTTVSLAETPTGANMEQSRAIGPTSSDDMLPIIIGASVGGACCLIVVALLVALFAKRRGEKTSPTSAVVPPTQMRAVTPQAAPEFVSARDEYQQIDFGGVPVPETLSVRTVSSRSLGSNDPYGMMPKMNVGGGYDIVPSRHGTGSIASESSSYVNLPSQTVEEFT